jgi:hypothetical protein
MPEKTTSASRTNLNPLITQMDRSNVDSLPGKTDDFNRRSRDEKLHPL